MKVIKPSRSPWLDSMGKHFNLTVPLSIHYYHLSSLSDLSLAVVSASFQVPNLSCVLSFSMVLLAPSSTCLTQWNVSSYNLWWTSSKYLIQGRSRPLISTPNYFPGGGISYKWDRENCWEFWKESLKGTIIMWVWLKFIFTQAMRYQ